MTNDRKLNFATTDEELAKKWSTPEHKWTAENIADWREVGEYNCNRAHYSRYLFTH
ncbi:hypothetical protein [Metabacillus malikii]|uniref:Uncharacterized protein n=1 Tax=Metabacillus malikii TaxID=1504265 RepID=A0ABT9ZIX8_9BACI|nr:hypothetical protein [Metabacillus malikii]MDQ0231498.1 hypothetical protein [Metabacillus malikii]